MSRHRPLGSITPKDRERFVARVDITDACHIWGGSRDKHGRGRFSLNGHPCVAPRVAYAMSFTDPGSMSVLHRCDNPSCVNPAHLLLGDQAQNMADAKAKGRTCRGSRNGHNKRAGKLNEMAVIAIRSAIRAGARTGELARIYGVGPGQISNIKTGTKWSWVNG